MLTNTDVFDVVLGVLADHVSFLVKIRKMHLHNFIIISPWEKAWPFPFYWTNLNPHHPKIFCAKFDWHWPRSSRNEDFKKKFIKVYSHFMHPRDRRSVCLSFYPPLWKFNLANNFWTVRARALIFHMSIPCDKTFPWVSFFLHWNLTLEFDPFLETLTLLITC